MYAGKCFLLVAVSLISTVPVLAERIYTAQASVSVVTAADDNPFLGARGSKELAKKRVDLVYGLYPSITMNSTSTHSDFQLSYAFGLEKVGTEPGLDSTKSHGLEAKFQTSLNQKLKMELSESYVRSPDFGTFNFQRGIAFTPGDAPFRYSTVTLRRNGYFNGLNVGFNYALNPVSGLSWTLAHIVRSYEDTVADGRLSNLQELDAALRYNRRIDKRTSWSAGYLMYQHHFRDYMDSRTLSGEFGLLRQISPSISVGVIAGPSETLTLGPGPSYLGYNGSLNLWKSLKQDKINFAYYRQSGTSMGIGSISDNQGVAFRYSRSFGRKAAVGGAASLYDARQRLDNPLQFKGITASLTFDVLLRENWALSGGGSYQKQKGTDIIDLQRKRLFISLKFVMPDFLRLER